MAEDPSESPKPPPNRPRPVRQAWGEALIDERRLAAGEAVRYPDILGDGSGFTLLLCTGSAALEGTDARQPVAHDPAVLLHPGASVTVRAETVTTVLTVRVPALSAGAGPMSVPADGWEQLEPGAYVFGIRSMVAVLLELAAGEGSTNPALVQSLLKRVVTGVAVR